MIEFLAHGLPKLLIRLLHRHWPTVECHAGTCLCGKYERCGVADHDWKPIAQDADGNDAECRTCGSLKET